MKKLVFMVLLMLTKVAFCQENINGQKLKDYVFGVPQMDLVKQLPDFKNSLKTINGLEFHGFCESQHLLMVRMPESSMDAFSELMDKMELSFNVKKQASFQIAEKVCNAKEEILYSKSINQ
ncbi:MAG TPA: hypothetical protein PLU85_02930 [Bacteroidia bacterium]|nr:hypothetical protein [Bacteroidia bacterium]QQR94396.1 MAG: hypothetical protein IPJ93_11115 [Bacteroidota bacterium]MBP7713983.1 hypothetical protein [Bacteroidia bacterium]MBP8667744.1 hypothetical protein [Bacteroidia bacterium]HOZ83007.1 hypothetical protein [Bacteroidia bacterium]